VIKRKEETTMKKALKSLVVVTFAVALSFSLGTGSAKAGNHDDTKSYAPKGKGLPTPYSNRTILDTLVRTDGLQALVAAIKVVDESDIGNGEPIIKLGELLDKRSVKLVLLAPSNEGFEQLLALNPGALEGLDADTIASLLPTLLIKVGHDKDSLYNVLLKHVSVVEKGSAPSIIDLLKSGHITVLDESDFPVAIGGKGVHINYESHITEHDVFTVNGVIHYLDNVIVDAEEEQEPPPDDDDEVVEWCNRDLCEVDPLLYDKCVDFMIICLAAGNTIVDAEQCAGAGVLICSEIGSIFD